jgi:O-antigen/teichoic acid export membrane protein
MKSPFTLHQSVYFALGIVIMKSVALLMLPVVTHYLAPAQFGELELLVSISDFATILVGFALVDALYRFAGDSKDAEDEKQIGATIFSLSLITATISLVIGLLIAPVVHPMFGPGISLLDVQLTILLFSIDACLVVPLGWLKLKENAFTFFVLTTGKGVSQAFISWQLLKSGYGITSILLGGAITSIMLAAILAKMQISQTGLRLDPKRLPQLLPYCAPLVVSALAAFALLSVDRWVITMVSTSTDVGLYAVAKKLALIAVLAMQPFVLWWSARRFKELNQPDGKTSVARIVSLGIALVMCFAALVCVASPIVIDLMIDPAYASSVALLPAIALVYTVKQIAELANIGSFVGKSTWNVMSIDLIAAVVSITCLYFFSQAWQVNGVIAALLLAQCLRATMFYISSQRVIRLDYAKRKLAVLAVACCLLTYVSTQITSLTQHFVMVMASAVILGAYLHVSGLFSFSPIFKSISQKLRPVPDIAK